MGKTTSFQMATAKSVSDLEEPPEISPFNEPHPFDTVAVKESVKKPIPTHAEPQKVTQRGDEVSIYELKESLKKIKSHVDLLVLKWFHDSSVFENGNIFGQDAITVYKVHEMLNAKGYEMTIEGVRNILNRLCAMRLLIKVRDFQKSYYSVRREGNLIRTLVFEKLLE